jgi:hypothetical protein
LSTRLDWYVGDKALTLEMAVDLRAVIGLFKAWHSTAPMIKFTGRQGNAQKLARILPVFQAFVATNAARIRETCGYAPEKDKNAGQKAEFYALFRDQVLPIALREIRADARGVTVESIPATSFLYKPDKSIRCIVGWELVARQTAAPAPVLAKKVVEAAAPAPVAVPVLAKKVRATNKKRKRAETEETGGIMAFGRFVATV